MNAPQLSSITFIFCTVYPTDKNTGEVFYVYEDNSTA